MEENEFPEDDKDIQPTETKCSRCQLIPENFIALNCQHNFCLQCLSKPYLDARDFGYLHDEEERIEINCEICNQPTELDSTSIEALESNIFQGINVYRRGGGDIYNEVIYEESNETHQTEDVKMPTEGSDDASPSRQVTNFSGSKRGSSNRMGDNLKNRSTKSLKIDDKDSQYSIENRVSIDKLPKQLDNSPEFNDKPKKETKKRESLSMDKGKYSDEYRIKEYKTDAEFPVNMKKYISEKEELDEPQRDESSDIAAQEHEPHHHHRAKADEEFIGNLVPNEDPEIIANLSEKEKKPINLENLNFKRKPNEKKLFPDKPESGNLLKKEEEIAKVIEKNSNIPNNNFPVSSLRDVRRRFEEEKKERMGKSKESDSKIKPKPNADRAQSNKMCQIHPDEEVNLFCFDCAGSSNASFNSKLARGMCVECYIVHKKFDGHELVNITSANSIKTLKKALSENEEVLKGKYDILALLQTKIKEKTNKMAPRLEEISTFVFEEMKKIHQFLREKERQLVIAAEKYFLGGDEGESETLDRCFSLQATLHEELLKNIKEGERNINGPNENLSLFIKYAEYKQFLKSELETMIEKSIQKSTQNLQEIHSIEGIENESIRNDIAIQFDKLKSFIDEITIEPQIFISHQTEYENIDERKPQSSNLLGKSNGFSKSPQTNEDVSLPSATSSKKSNPIYVFPNFSPKAELQAGFGKDFRDKLADQSREFKRNEEEFFNKGQTANPSQIGKNSGGYQHFLKNSYARNQNSAGALQENPIVRASASPSVFTRHFESSHDSSLQEFYQDSEETSRDRTYRKRLRLDNLDKIMTEIMNTKSSGWKNSSKHQTSTTLNSSFRKIIDASPEVSRPSYSQYLIGKSPKNSFPLRSFTSISDNINMSNQSLLERYNNNKSVNSIELSSPTSLGYHSSLRNKGDIIRNKLTNTPLRNFDIYNFSKKERRKDLFLKDDSKASHSVLLVSSKPSTPLSMEPAQEDIARSLLTPSSGSSKAMNHVLLTSSKNDKGLLKQREIFEKRKKDFVSSSRKPF